MAMLEIGDDSAGQRIDNFLFRTYKGVPKSHIYRILRSGEVRVNKGRIHPAYRLATGDMLRMPPLRVASPEKAAGGSIGSTGIGSTGSTARSAHFPALPVLYEDDHLLAIDKPAGIAVHGGSGISLGVIEQFRQARKPIKFLELVHRLDRQTSGILLIAKKRTALVNLHAQIRNNQIDKRYLVCVHADRQIWQKHQRIVALPLHKYLTSTGERRVCVHAQGQPARTVFSVVKRFAGYTLLEAELKTGRTHQIRVHLAHLGAPIVGDDKYGDFSLNRELVQANARPRLKRMFLHAFKLRLAHPATNLPLTLSAPLPADCQHFLNELSSPST